MKLCILLACAFAYVGYVQGAGLLFPHMAGNGDTQLVPELDDTFVCVTLICKYRFYCTSYSSIYIGTNGYVTFDVGEWRYVPRLMSTVTNLGWKMIAPLFSDNYLDNTPPNNNIWYRETEDPAMLTKANDIIQSQFPCCGGPCFEATWVLIITWQRVKSYCDAAGWRSVISGDNMQRLAPEKDPEDTGDRGIDGTRDDAERWHLSYTTTNYYGGITDGINGYQLVLATDGYQTYAIFNMHTIEWDYCWDYNTSGFSAGDSSRSCDLPGSGDPSIVNLTTGSNVGKPGRWVYRVDGCDVLDPGCNMC